MEPSCAPALFFTDGGRKGSGATWRRSGRRRGGRGDRTYPVAYEYDHAGRMVKMTTWQSFTNPENAGGAAETHWNYNARGLLVSKRYNDNTGPDYEYYGNGRLKMRTWARQIEGQALTTSYTYNNAGDLLGINYSDATADVAFVYDRLGRKTTISDAAGTRTIGYDPVTGQPDTEVVAAGGVYGLETTLDYDYDALGRRIRLAGSLPPPTADFNGDGMVDVGDLGILSANYGRNLRQEGIPEDQWRSLGDVNNNGKVDIGDLGALSAQYGSSSSMGATHYTYDAASRLATIKDGEGGSLDNGVTYSYLQNSSLLSQAQFAVGTTAKMTTLRSFDTLNRLTSINSTPTGGSTIGYSYTYNAANQRTGQVLSDGSNWTYGYDALGQLTSAPRKFSDNVGVPGQQFTYTYDTIGNRTTASVTGETQRTVNYTANALNQYTQRSVPDEVDIAGYTAFASDTVVVNNAAPSTRRGTFYYEELDFNGANGSNAYNTTVPFKITSGDGSIVRDNSDASTEFWGTWTPSTSGTGYQGGDFLHDNNGDKGDLSALFYPSVPAVGNFSIYMRWPTWANQSSNASNLTVAISYKNGAYYTEKTVNQRQDLSASGYWYYLGNYPLSPGINDYVGYSNFDTDGYVLVDAFKFVPETLTPLPIYLAQTPEVFSYDDDGNLISDGRWQYFYDGENRLIRMESRTTVSTSRRRKLTFTYDYLGRRVKKAVYTWNTSTSAYNTSPSGGSKFVYDGWNLIAELGVSDVKLIRSCTWGQDLSGSLQGAGGIGGLVFVRQYGTEAGSYYPAYDANGNLTAMIRADDKSVVASYDYSPYGELLASSGSYASTNPFRFSTKYTDVETNLAYFGYRYYNPDTGRWLNRDPIEEKGGGNLYGYAQNNPIMRIDPLGMKSEKCAWGIECGEIITDTWTEWLGWLVGFRHCNLYNIDKASGSRENQVLYPVEIDRKTSRHLQDGVHTNKPCKCATCGDIGSCISAVARRGHGASWGNNCQSMLDEQISKCCLKTNWKPNWYGRKPPNPWLLMPPPIPAGI
jgi:RHS repeat-associated protein